MNEASHAMTAYAAASSRWVSAGWRLLANCRRGDAIEDRQHQQRLERLGKSLTAQGGKDGKEQDAQKEPR
jgi:hypothetical protein